MHLLLIMAASPLEASPKGAKAAPVEIIETFEDRYEAARLLYKERAGRFPTPLEIRSRDPSTSSSKAWMSRSASMPSISGSSAKDKTPKRPVPTWEEDAEAEEADRLAAEAEAADWNLALGSGLSVPVGERDTLRWIGTDRRFKPACPALDKPDWPAPYHKYKPKTKPGHELWLPNLACYPKSKEEKEKEKAEKEKEGSQEKSEEDPASSSTATRPRWFPRHQITDSHCNAEIQCGLRNYFGLPGIPIDGSKPGPYVSDPYHFTDRCMSFPDHRSVFDTVRYGGVKETQLPSQWRMQYNKKVVLQEINPQIGWMDGLKLSKKLQQRVDKKSKAQPKARRPKADSDPFSSPHVDMLKKVSGLSPDESVKYWKTWSETSKMRLPEDPKKNKKKKKKGQKAQSDDEAERRKFEEIRSPKQRGKKRWDPRFAVMMSKDNEVLHDTHRKYFTKPVLLSGIQYGECERLLSMNSNKWKALK